MEKNIPSNLSLIILTYCYLFQGNEADEISYASVNITKAQKNKERQITQDTVYARINEK